MAFVRQFAMERFLPESPDYGQGFRTALMGEADLYAGDVLGAANPMHAYNAKRALAEYGMQAKKLASQVPAKPNPFNQALGTAAQVVSLAAPFMGNPSNAEISSIMMGDKAVPGTVSIPGAPKTFQTGIAK